MACLIKHCSEVPKLELMHYASSRILLLLTTVAFAVLGSLASNGKLPNATVSYFLGSSFFVAGAIFSAFLASSFCVEAK